MSVSPVWHILSFFPVTGENSFTIFQLLVKGCVLVNGIGKACLGKVWLGKLTFPT